jgi:hypothetical protein
MKAALIDEDRLHEEGQARLQEFQVWSSGGLNGEAGCWPSDLPARKASAQATED